MRDLSFFQILCLSLVGSLITSCAGLKDPGPQPEVLALSPTSSGLLAATSRSFRNTHPNSDSGFYLLENSNEALLTRLALADLASRYIDVQYFIWQNDETGRLLLDRLVDAADRGVRVRLLVDDLVLAGDDRNIAAITHHPNFDIKVFNPNNVRKGIFAPIFSFLTNFRELNRRMHNKVFVVDNQFAVVGGRNIGNEYFGLSTKYNFRDLDVLTTGPVIPEISKAFDEYWNAETAYPGYALSPKTGPDRLDHLRQDFEGRHQADRAFFAATPYPFKRQDWSRQLRHLTSRMHSGEAHFIQDEPVTHRGEQRRLLDTLEYLAEPSHKELLIVTPYLIPVGDFLEDLERLAREGVKVTIVTGGMDSNNHTVAHAHYRKYRKPVLRGGSTLVEYKSQPEESQRNIADVPPVESDFICLHIKTLVGDRQRCFIGSLNLDPRAMVINTENGLLIDSPGLSRQLASRIDAMKTPENAWNVTLDSHNRLHWTSSDGTRTSEPARTFGQRFSAFFFQLLPIESQL
jgi:putative cardiolipin synthase